MRVQASINNPPPQGQDFEARWQGPDCGLICAWLAGQHYAGRNADIAAQAKAGALPVLPFKGGVTKKLKADKPKPGSLWYVAMWHGLRGENLDMDTETELELSCSETGQTVLFTPDSSKYSTEE